MSKFYTVYEMIYDRICGKYPHLRPWHFQWLAVRDLLNTIAEHLPSAEGSILDVGCGEQPYRGLFEFKKVTCVIGIDIYPAPHVDVIVSTTTDWPFIDGQFDSVICFQVLEHTAHLETTLDEIVRVLKPGGKLLLSVPFIYNEHGAPNDFRRYSPNGVFELLKEQLEIVENLKIGNVGSVLSTLFLNWVETQSNRNKISRFTKAILLPLWILLSLSCNLVGRLLDTLDGTWSFFLNVFVVAVKK